PDGAQAVASLDGEAPIVVDLGRRAILGRLPGARGAEGARVAYDDDGRFTVAAAELTRWDFRALLPRQLSFPTGITDLAVSRDGRRLAVAWNDTVQVLDPVGRTVSATHRLDERRLASDRAPFVKAIALAPDGDMLVASTLSDAALARFDPFTPLPPLSGGDAGSSHRRLGVLPDGSVLGADYDRSVRRLTPEGPTRIGAATTAERAPEAFAAVDLAVSPSGEWAVAVTLDGGLYRAHGVESGGLFEPLARAPRAVAVAIEDDGAAWSASSDGVRGWTAASVERTPLSAAAGNLVAVAAAGGLVAAGAKDGAIYVWKQGEPSPWAVVRDHRKRVDTLVIEPRGRFIAAGSWDGRLSFLRWPDEPVGEGVAEAERRWGIGLDELGDAPP
ncbi:MAG: WD40 repeat domain-containing protein, partial [Myxococcales bacterium]|nr:WD40 repeat domain-containing protein [Myxococcales bacterium]